MNWTFEINTNNLVIFFMAAFIVVCAVFVLIILIEIIVALKKTLNNIFLKKRKPKQKAIRKWIVNIIARLITIVVLGAIIISDYKSINAWNQMSAMLDEEKKAAEAASQQYLTALKNIPFQNEVRNEEILWEKLLNERLMYKEYLIHGSMCSNFAGLRSYYQENSENMVEWPKIDINKLVEQVEAVYDSELLPATKDTFININAEIAAYDDALMVPADVYKAEFWVRISMGKEDYSSEALYQIGRAADDVLKVLTHTNKITPKEWLFFGSMAVSFYLASMEHNDGLRDLPLTFYRIAEIFIYLDKYSPLKTTEAYSRHFRLMAEMALGEAEDAFDDTYEQSKIRVKMPYFYCYYADILYDFSKLCPNGEENLAEICREYAGQCVMGDTEGECCASCRALLEKLK